MKNDCQQFDDAITSMMLDGGQCDQRGQQALKMNQEC